MAGLENMKKRLGHNGGDIQNNRMIKGKLETLKRAMKASYAAATAITDTGEFSCLINPNKQNETYDNKVLSIPFRAPNLINPEVGEIETGVAAGKVIEWKENNTFWLIYLPRLNEKAYFRADLKRCQHEVEVNGETYKIATEFISPDEIRWETKSEIYWNTLNYSMSMYITKDENTLEYFKRFSEIKIGGQNWQVQAVDRINVEGVLVIVLKEFYENSIKEEIAAEKEENKLIEPNIDIDTDVYIKGDKEVYPYDKKTYTIENDSSGYWEINSSKVKILKNDNSAITIEVITGKSGAVSLLYKRDGKEDIELPIKILSL